MDKLPMCRICLAENVRMYVVVDKTLRDLYERLTDNPFVTKDSRPILACYICCAQLKKCCRFQKKCLDAEEQFAQMIMINEDYEEKPFINQDQFEIFHGFIRTPIKSISTVDVDQTESIFVKEELPAVCERHDNIIQLKEEHERDDDVKIINKYDDYMDIEDTPVHHSESDSEDHQIQIEKFKIKVKNEQEASKRKLKAKKTNRAPVTKKSKRKGGTSTRKQTKIRRSTSNTTTSAFTRTNDPIFHTKLAQKGANSVFNLSDLINTAIDTNYGNKRDSDKILNSLKYK